ncbi:MAG: NRDE family protein [Pseudomonadota bacterium]
MCLLAIAWRCHQRYDLVFVGNRDEFYERPTQAATWWTAGERDMLGGRDLLAGGTWLGLRGDGAFATVTNVREPRARRDGARSRGHLITALMRADDPLGALAGLREDGERYAHYNLLAGTLTPTPRLAYLNNVEGDLRQNLPAGVYVLSNHRLDTPWPKAQRIRRAIQSLVDEPSRASDDQTLIDALFTVMSDRNPAPDNTLPATGLSPDRERALSSPFIETPGYGTRATTVILARAGGEARFVEQGYEAGGVAGARVDERFSLGHRA